MLCVVTGMLVPWPGLDMFRDDSAEVEVERHGRALASRLRAVGLVCRFH